MANFVVACIVDNQVVLWTDANPRRGEAYTRRNIRPVGLHCVALHDDVDAWLPVLEPSLGDDSLANLSLEDLTARIQEVLRSHRIDQPLGAIVAGMSSAGASGLLGLGSSRDFDVLRFFPSVIGGLPASLWNYLLSVLHSIPDTLDNVIDLMLIAGEAYYQAILSKAGMPKGDAIALLRPGEPLAWLSDEDMAERRLRNAHRLQRFQALSMMHFLERRG